MVSSSRNITRSTYSSFTDYSFKVMAHLLELTEYSRRCRVVEPGPGFFNPAPLLPTININIQTNNHYNTQNNYNNVYVEEASKATRDKVLTKEEYDRIYNNKKAMEANLKVVKKIRGF